MPIDEARAFRPVRIALLTISDSRTLAEDKSGDALAQRIADAGHILADRALLRDDADDIVALLHRWVDDSLIDCVITTGGTGLTGRDVTPEALARLGGKDIPGFGELFRWLSYAKIGTSTIQSRATGGVLNATFVFVLPGSPGACTDAWDGILKAQLDYRHMPCNFVEIMPRLEEHRRG